MPVQHILIIHQGALGDLIVSLPCLHAIRRAFPGVFIEVMGYPGILSLLNQRFYADAICSVDRAEMASLYHEQGNVSSDLSTYLQKYEKIFFFGGEAQKIAVQNLKSLFGPDIFHIKIFPAGKNKHVIDFQLEQLRARGYDTAIKNPKIILLDEDITEAETMLVRRFGRTNNNPLIAIHPGSGSAKKNWPVDHFTALIQELCRARQVTMLLIEGPADGHIVSQLSSNLAQIFPVILHSPALPVLAAVLKKCALFIGNDSGITHLAAAMGIPVAAIFGPSDPRVWGPRGDAVMLITGEVRAGTEPRWIAPSAVLGMVVPILNALPAA